MKKRTIFFIIGIFLFFNQGCNNKEVQEHELMIDNVTSYKLSNGLEILLNPDKRTKVSAIQMWVKVGSSDETDAEGGMSHVLEHMLFKGTEKRGVGDIAREIESLGGDVNAYTSDDETVFHLVVPAEYTVKGLDIISDMIQNSVLEENEFEKEKKVILEEIKRGQDDPSRRLFKEISKAIYKKHPYRRPVIGFPEVVSGFSRDSVYNYYKKWYVPNNMVLVVSGNFDKKSVESKIISLFDDFTYKKVNHKNHVESGKSSFEIKVIKEDVPKTYLSVSYLTTPLVNKDTAVLDIFADFLSGDEDKLLNKKLVFEKKLVYSVNSFNYTPKDKGFFSIISYLDEKNLMPVLKEIYSSINKYSIETPTNDLVELIKKENVRDFIFSMERVQGIARQLGSNYILSGDYNYGDKYLSDIKKTTPKEISSVVKKYLSPLRAKIVIMLPKTSKLDTDELERKIVENWRETATISQVNIDKNNLSDSITKYKLPDGPTVILENRSELPVVSLVMTLPGGYLYTPQGKSGLPLLLAEMWGMRTKTLNPEKFAKTLNNIGGKFNIYCEREYLNLKFTFLSEYYDEAMSFLSQVIQEPSFTEDDLILKRKNEIAYVESMENDMMRYSYSKFIQVLYKGYPFAYDKAGKIEDLRSITLEDINNYFNKIFKPEDFSLSVVGDINKDKTINDLQRIFSVFKNKKNFSFKLPNVVFSSLPQKYFEKKNKNQTHILIGFPGITRYDKDRYAVRILDDILSGMGNRLFVNLRDKKSLAYVVTTIERSPSVPGYFIFYLATSPDKANFAVKSLKEEINKILEKGFTKKEMEQAVQFRVGSIDIYLQPNDSFATVYSLNNFFYNKPLQYEISRKEYKKVTLKQLNETAKRLFDFNKSLTVIVGPEDIKE